VTVDALTKALIEIIELERKRRLNPEVFNISVFETTLSSGRPNTEVFGDILPVTELPRYLDRLYNTDLTLAQFSNYSRELPPILAMALTTSSHNMEDFLDPDILGDAYKAAYRLLFVRAMTDILKTNFSSAIVESFGHQHVEMEAVIMEPVFTCLVGGLLPLVSISAMALLYITVVWKRKGKLSGDPSMCLYALEDQD
jgi:hypothetical protein